MLGVLGTGVVATSTIGRRVMLLTLMPAWGYSTVSSTPVGQHVGSGDAETADECGRQILRTALATQPLIAVVLFVAALAIGGRSARATSDPLCRSSGVRGR